MTITVATRLDRAMHFGKRFGFWVDFPYGTKVSGRKFQSIVVPDFLIDRGPLSKVQQSNKIF